MSKTTMSIEEAQRRYDELHAKQVQLQREIEEMRAELESPVDASADLATEIARAAELTPGIEGRKRVLARLAEQVKEALEALAQARYSEILREQTRLDKQTPAMVAAYEKAALAFVDANAALKRHRLVMETNDRQLRKYASEKHSLPQTPRWKKFHDGWIDNEAASERIRHLWELD